MRVIAILATIILISNCCFGLPTFRLRPTRPQYDVEVVDVYVYDQNPSVSTNQRQPHGSTSTINMRCSGNTCVIPNNSGHSRLPNAQPSRSSNNEMIVVFVPDNQPPAHSHFPSPVRVPTYPTVPSFPHKPSRIHPHPYPYPYPYPQNPWQQNPSVLPSANVYPTAPIYQPVPEPINPSLPSPVYPSTGNGGRRPIDRRPRPPHTNQQPQTPVSTNNNPTPVPQSVNPTPKCAVNDFACEIFGNQNQPDELPSSNSQRPRITTPRTNSQASSTPPMLTGELITNVLEPTRNESPEYNIDIRSIP